MKPGKTKRARKSKGRRHQETRESHPSLSADCSGGEGVDELDDGALQFIANALTSGKLIAPISFEEIEREHPILWRRAQEVFGDSEISCSWFETPTGRFGGQCPLSFAMRAGGEKQVLRELERLEREFIRSQAQTPASQGRTANASCPKRSSKKPCLSSSAPEVKPNQLK